MKWEELIAEARAAGVLAFCADGIAVLNQQKTTTDNTDQARIKTTEEEGPLSSV